MGRNSKFDNDEDVHCFRCSGRCFRGGECRDIRLGSALHYAQRLCIQQAQPVLPCCWGCECDCVSVCAVHDRARLPEGRVLRVCQGSCCGRGCGVYRAVCCQGVSSGQAVHAWRDLCQRDARDQQRCVLRARLVLERRQHACRSSGRALASTRPATSALLAQSRPTETESATPLRPRAVAASGASGAQAEWRAASWASTRTFSPRLSSPLPFSAPLPLSLFFFVDILLSLRWSE